MILSITALSIILVLGLCVIQKTKARQDAAFVYVALTSLHFVCFDEKMDGGLWPLYYVSAGLFGLWIMERLNGLKSYTVFHVHLQRIAFCSVVINFLGGAIQFAGGSLLVYECLGGALYLILIWELLKDGRNRRIPKIGSLLYNLFRHPV